MKNQLVNIYVWYLGVQRIVKRYTFKSHFQDNYDFKNNPLTANTQQIFRPNYQTDNDLCFEKSYCGGTVYETPPLCNKLLFEINNTVTFKYYLSICRELDNKLVR